MRGQSPITGGAALKRARVALDLTREEFGRAVGLSGDARSNQVKVSMWETGAAPVPKRVGLLAECFLAGARPSSWPD